MASVRPAEARLAYVCETGGRVGWGHVARGRALLEAAPVGSTLVVGRGYDEVAPWASRLGIPVDRWHETSTPFDPRSAPYDTIAVDHYGLSSEWIASVAARRPTFVVDDWMRDTVDATGLVNPNLGAVASDYRRLETRYSLLGSQYVLLRDEVLRHSRRADRTGEVRRVLVTLGGSDPEGRSADVVALLAESRWYARGGAVTVVLGPSYAGDRPWERWPHGARRALTVVEQPQDFVSRCVAADVVVCGASVSSYEMAWLQVPFVPLVLVDNQRRVGDAWADRGIGPRLAVWDADWAARLALYVDHVLSDPKLRDTLVSTAAAVVDGRGRARVCAALAAAHETVR